MKLLNSPTSIKALWYNSTDSNITVLVNGDQNIGNIAPDAVSQDVTLVLSADMMLDISLIEGDNVHNPYLVWMQNKDGSPSILQQSRRYDMWEVLPQEGSAGGSSHLFTIAQDADGLVIVGTVEFVEEDLIRENLQRQPHSSR